MFLASLNNIRQGFFSLVHFLADGVDFRSQISDSVVDTLHIYLLCAQFWFTLVVSEPFSGYLLLLLH